AILKDDGAGAATAAIRRARQAGVPVSVTPGSAGYLAEFGAARFVDAIAGAEIVFPNLAEGRLMSGQEDPERIGRALLERFPNVALTMGSTGALLCVRDRPPLHVPASTVARFVDPTGAGDAFAAGFLARWI